MWAEHGIWSYTFEMYPPSQEQGGFYPTDNVIGPQTSRNECPFTCVTNAEGSLM